MATILQDFIEESFTTLPKPHEQWLSNFVMPEKIISLLNYLYFPRCLTGKILQAVLNKEALIHLRYIFLVT